MLRTVKRLRTGVRRLHRLPETPHGPLSSLALVAELVSTILHSLALMHKGAQALATVPLQRRGHAQVAAPLRLAPCGSTAVGRELGDEGDAPIS
ncbi:hypothetical protein AB1Y20_014678 [Prymnesium parvum]|uniref:Uncharacterized protein n=1 Tax=Prymnesium parvum TaxID=97485 RepID=A0AB34IDT7_PRYPA